MNTLAVERTEAGRLEEARNAPQIALASPFASAYPEWRKTREEIKLKGWRAPRSVVALNQKTREASNHVHRLCPSKTKLRVQPSPATEPAGDRQLARVEE